MIRVLFADDEDMIRTALATLLDLEEDIHVIASVGDGTEAVAKALELEPDVCLLDLEMPGHDGVEAAEKIAEKITAKSIIVTRHARPGVLRRAMSAGVAGFVTKSTPASELAEVIRAVADGKRHVDPDIAASALTAERTPLTDRELDVLRIGRDAATVQDIARQLHLAPGTVRNYLSQAMRKLGVATRREASDVAWEEGWI